MLRDGYKRGTIHVDVNRDVITKIDMLVHHFTSDFHNMDPMSLAKNNNIIVVQTKLFEQAGFATDNTIFINDLLDSYSKKIVCAHELGHILLHKGDDFNCFDDSDELREFEANCFASYIMPQILANISREKKYTMSEFNREIFKKVIIPFPM